jgi:hypothetical protein
VRRTATAIIAGLTLVAGTAGAQTMTTAPLTAEQKDWRYRVGVMERVLEGAAEHGAALTRERLQKALPAQMMIAESPHVRGFQLAGYGVFFDVEMPSLDGTIDGTLLWSLQTLDQNDLGLQSALEALKSFVASAKDPSLQQALKRVELQVAPATALFPTAPDAAPGAAMEATGSAAAAVAPMADTAKAADPILNDPIEAYHTEVMRAIMDAMLEHSGPLAIGPDAWLTVAVRRSSDRPRLTATDDDSRTFLARINGAGLRNFRSGLVSKEEALKLIEVRVY